MIHPLVASLLALPPTGSSLYGLASVSVALMGLVALQLIGTNTPGRAPVPRRSSAGVGILWVMLLFLLLELIARQLAFVDL